VRPPNTGVCGVALYGMENGMLASRIVGDLLHRNSETSLQLLGSGEVGTAIGTGFISGAGSLMGRSHAGIYLYKYVNKYT
jgi:hypothetical protein